PGDFNASGVVRGGIAHLIGAIEQARSECRPPTCHSIWIDGGDQWQGSPASNSTYGRTVVEVFNRFNLAASALGNHEFDWGLDTLRARMREARYRFMAVNVTDTLGNDVDWIPNDTLIDLGALKVGVVGVLTVATPTATRFTNVAGFHFRDPAPLVDRQVRSLRARGADVVLVAAHAGASCERDDISRCEGEIIEMAGKLTERVDGIVAGHLHRAASTTVKGTAITQAYTKGTAIGIIDIPLEGEGERARTSLRNVMPDSSPRNAEAARMVAPVTERARAEFDERVVRIAEPIRRGTAGNLGNLIADSQRWAARGDIALMNSGGVRVDLAPGWVTEGDIFNVLPFDNVLMRITVRGAELREYLERIIARNTTQFHLSGIVVEFDASRPPGERLVRTVLSDGRALDPRREYTLIISDFLMAGGDGLGLSERAVSVEDTGILFRRALSRYLRTLPQPVREPTDRRLIRR
ncbi:MAG: bifunctional metallophosphatase/5'-nucleotidase, partial [Gemmatimonadota bacterium]